MAYPPLTGLFAERYVIERELGHGATAVVYLAHDNKHNRDIALKVLSKDLAHALGPERFLREIQFTTRLHHPHILPIFDSGEWNGMLYYVLPYVRGESLRQKIDRETQLPIEECVRITCEVADALAHAHSQGIVHRDVKPENIMLSDGHALLADFGIARTLDVHTGERLTSSGLIVGTSAYMSPEQAAGEDKIDARSDIYSLACVLYEMIAGVQAFTGPTTQSVIAQRFKHTPRPVSTFRPQVPEYLENALSKALSISPADRFSTIKKFAAELPEVPTAGSDRRRAPIRRMIHDNQKAFGFGAAALVVLSAAMVAVNPPGNWRSPFARHAVLDSAKYIVVPSPSPGHSDIGAKDLDAVAHLTRAMQKWNGLALVDPQVVSDAVASKRLVQSGDAFELAKRNGAGRLIRVNATGDASVSDVTTGTVINDVSTDDVKGATDSTAAMALRLLSAKDRPKAAEGGDGATNSFPAWRAYGEAHAALAKNDLAAATRSFRLAASFDPAFLPARLWDAQVTEWIAPADSLAWGSEALLAASDLTRYTSRDRSLALGLAALARRDYPAACGEYKKLVQADSADFAAWLGFGECQRMDRLVLPWRASPSGYRFRSSFRAAGDAYLRAVRANPAAYDLVGFSRMRDIKSTETAKMRGGYDSGRNFYGANSFLDHDTIAYNPYPIALFGAATRPATRAAAIEKDLGDLLAFATNWVRAAPNSAQGYEALAMALESRGEIDRGAFGSISASTALTNALRLTANRSQRVRLIASEIRLRIKRADYVGARTLSDSLLRAETHYDDAVAEELVPPAVFTGRIELAAKIALATNTVVTDVGPIRVPPQVGETQARLLAHAALGDCGSAIKQLQGELGTKLTSYFSERDRAAVSRALLSRINSMLSPCTNGQSALAIEAPDRLQRMQQIFARGDLRRVRAMFDSLDAARRFLRASDMSLDYTYQEAWLRAASGDTAGAIHQLDQTLDALPMVSARTMKEFGGAASLARAFMLRSDLAFARGDRTVGSRYARAVVDLWTEADPELQSYVARLQKLAGGSK